MFCQGKPHQVALKCGEQTITYGKLGKVINKKAATLNQQAPSLMTRQADKTIDFVIECLACLQTATPLALFPMDWTKSQCETRKQELLTAQHLGQIHPQTQLILFTSGSSSKPKAVQLSQQNLMANCQAVRDALHFNDATSQALFLPLSYSYGLLGQLLPGLMSGHCIHLLTSVIELLALFKSNQLPNMLSGVPSHWQVLTRFAAQYPKSAQTISHVISAGAPLSLALRKTLIDGFSEATVYTNYGQTEASPRVLCLSSRAPHFLSSATGFPIGDWQVKLSPQQELLIKGPQVMLGFIDAPSPITNGWLNTFDLADIDQQGLITIKGRLDKTIKISGEKVNLSVLEQQIKTHAQADNAVLIALEDDLHGHRLVAYLESEKPLNQARSLDKLKTNLPNNLVPQKVEILKRLPRNHNGKIDTHHLTQLAKERSS